MVKFKITWQEEREALVDATDIKDAEQQMFDKIKKCPRPDAVKLLSIYSVDQPLLPPSSPIASAA